MEVLSRDESTAFLTRRIGGEHEPAAVATLAEVLGDLPLALEQAAAYIEQTATPVGEYVSLFAQRAKELFALGQPSNSQDTIATIWALSLERIRATTPAALDLLAVCAFLAPDDMPRDLLPAHADVLPERLEHAQAKPLLERALAIYEARRGADGLDTARSPQCAGRGPARPRRPPRRPHPQRARPDHPRDPSGRRPPHHRRQPQHL